MVQIIELIIGVIILAFGFPIGNYLASITKEELKQGQVWFKLIVILSFVGVLFSLIFRNDILFFTFAFVAIVTSRSLKR